MNTTSICVVFASAFVLSTATTNLGVTPQGGTNAAQSNQKACDDGNAEACYNLGVMQDTAPWVWVDGVTPGPAKAVQLYQKGCDGGIARSCLQLGWKYYEGFPVTKDIAKSVQLFQKACDIGDAQLCISIARIHESHLPGMAVQLYQKGVQLYQKDCDGGIAQSCIDLGTMYEQGDHAVTQDIAKAVQLFQKACDDGNAEGCYKVGLMYHSGRGVTRDVAKAVQFYQKACDGGSAEACGNLGLKYANGEGVGHDDAKAVQLYQRACVGGNAEGCRNLKLAQNKAAIVQSYQKIVQSYQKACSMMPAETVEIRRRVNLLFKQATGGSKEGAEQAFEELTKLGCKLEKTDIDRLSKVMRKSGLSWQTDPSRVGHCTYYNYTSVRYYAASALMKLPSAHVSDKLRAEAEEATNRWAPYPVKVTDPGWT